MKKKKMEIKPNTVFALKSERDPLKSQNKKSCLFRCTFKQKTGHVHSCKTK